MAAITWQDVTADWAKRPWWMNLIFYFCLYMTFIYMPFDIFYKPVAEDEEVWFGVTLVGWWAKATAPLHWLIYGGLAYGLWRMKSWVWLFATLYLGQIVIAMFFWNILDHRGGGVMAGAIAAAVFLLPTIAMYRSRETFSSHV